MIVPELIRKARGELPADLAVKNCRLVNVFSGEIQETGFGIADGLVLGFGDYEATEVLDAHGGYVCPGLIEGHIHIESTMMAPHRFAEAAARRGTAAVVADPHEIANVLGTGGIEYMIRATEGLPVAVYFMAPSCVPATHLEQSGATVTAQDIRSLLMRFPDRVIGLAEMMNVPGVLAGDPVVMEKLRTAGPRPIDGHAPLLRGKDLAAYILAGPGSDHESTTLDEAREKLRLGMHVMIREGTSEKNLDALVPLVGQGYADRLSLVSDDRHPSDLVENGHLDHGIRRAISRGVAPVTAIRMASLNTARYFGLSRRGALAPGYRGDFLVVKDLVDFDVRHVYLGGRRIEDCRFISPVDPPGNSMDLPELDETSFGVLPGIGRLRAIGIVPGQIVTEHIMVKPSLKGGGVAADPEKDLAKIAVVPRHRSRRTNGIGMGFVRGLGLERGCLASTVAHDSHNLIVVGMDDRDMLVAALRLGKMGGGLVVVEQGTVTAELPLPIAGLMADRDAREMAEAEALMDAAARRLGEHVIPHPFMVLSFLALPVIPHLKLTDRGLVDVDRFDFVPLFEG